MSEDKGDKGDNEYKGEKGDKMMHNKTVTTTKFFTMDGAIKAPIISNAAFIIANEYTKKDGEIGRFYTVFPKFRDFLHNRSLFSHCHEILIDHQNAKSNLAGRLVFDFDIKDVKIPPTFKNQIQDIVCTVVDMYFHNVDESCFEFVWSSSENPQKFSKHLTVKNLYFDDWLQLSDIFYKLFCLEWDKIYEWISAENLIDAQIVRQRASLRMVGSSKIGGYPLTLDEECYTLSDSLIRIYNQSTRDSEQLITKDNINACVIENVLGMRQRDYDMFTNTDGGDNMDTIMHSFRIGSSSISKSSDPAYKKKVYVKAFELINVLCPGIFKMGKIQDQILILMRIRSAKCLLSNRLHEHQNAYLTIYKDMTSKNKRYIVCFGCYRKCSKIKATQIGYIGKNLSDLSFNSYYDYGNEIIGKKIHKTKKKSKNNVGNLSPKHTMVADSKLKQIAHTIIDI